MRRAGRPNHKLPSSSSQMPLMVAAREADYRTMTKRTLLIGAAALGAAALSLAFFGRPLHAVAGALTDLGGADPVWLVAAGAAFLAGALASAAAWHRGLDACGAGLGRWDVARRYAAGCLANTVAPANAGEVVRVALLSRAMGSEGAVFTVIGVSAVVAVMRISAVAALFVVTAASGRSPIWLALVALPVAVLVACSFPRVRARLFAGKTQHVLDVVRGLAAAPVAALEMAGWVAVGLTAAVLASACVGAALGVPHALAAAVVIVPAIQLARMLPITPGNVGLTSAAVALALHGRGVPMESAMAAGIALHAVETIVGLTLGAAGAISLAPGLGTWPGRMRLHLGRVAAGAAPLALLLAVVTSAIGAHAALT